MHLIALKTASASFGTIPIKRSCIKHSFTISQIHTVFRHVYLTLFLLLSLLGVNLDHFHHADIGLNQINHMLKQNPACLTRTLISAQQDLHVRSL